MQDALPDVSAVIKSKLAELGVGDFDVASYRTNDSFSGTVSGLGDKNKTSTLAIKITNPAIERDPALEDRILAKLSEIPALSENVQFETDAKHAENLAKRLREFISDGAAIPESFVKWFDKATDPKTDGYGYRQNGDHALGVEKTDMGINIRIAVPKSADPAEIQKNIEGRIDAVKALLAERVVKYSPEAKTDAEKQALRDKVKALDFSVSSAKDEYASTVEIRILSAEQLAAANDTKLKRGAPVLPSEELKKLRESNPLNFLKDGKDQDAQLQKALARSILFAGDKALDIFPIIAGSKDMQVAIIKPLVKLKAAKPELAEKIDKFIADDTFKDHSLWTPGSEKSKPLLDKLGLRITRDGSEKYTPGEIEVKLSLPAGKFANILQDIVKPGAKSTTAASDAQVADQVLAAAAPDAVATEQAKQPMTATEPAGLGVVAQKLAPALGTQNESTEKMAEVLKQVIDKYKESTQTVGAGRG